MAAIPVVPARPGPVVRALEAVPLLGWVVKDIRKDTDSIFYALVIAITLLVLAVMQWGLVAITIVALALVPVMFALFIWICWP